MFLNQVPGNQPVQKQLQLDCDVSKQNNHLSATSREIGKSLIHSQTLQHGNGKSPLVKPAHDLYAFLAKICLRFKSFFTGKVAASGNNTYEIPPHLPKLVEGAHNRQGFVQLRSGSEKGMGKAILDCLNAPEFAQGIPVTKDQKIVGCYAEKIGFCSTQWRLQVYDSSEKEMVEVPLTVINLEESKPDDLADQMANIKVVMDIHLEAIHPAYQDSVEQPVVICDKQPEMATLLLAQEDLLSSLYSGQCKNFADMEKQISEVLHRVSPEHPLLESPEENRDFYANFLEVFEDNRENILTGQDMAPAHLIRALRRHLPVPVAADVSPPTLAGKSPLTRPSLLTIQADGALLQAYREPLKYLQCSVNAVNTFFQSEVVTAEKMASLTIDAMKEFSGDLSGITGLGKPEILNDIERGESVTIKKSDFLAPAPTDKNPELNLFDNSTPAEQWQDLINVIEPLGPRKDWVNHADELNSIQELTITPSDWLSAFAEVGLDTVTRVIKNILVSCEDNPDWSHLPEDVEYTVLMDKDEAAQNKKIVDLAKDIQTNIPVYMNLEKELSLIVLVGSGQSANNHFYTISYNKASDSWISLDSAGAKKAGIQDCAEFCKNSELEQALLNHKVQAAVVPPLYAISEIDATESGAHPKAD